MENIDVIAQLINVNENTSDSNLLNLLQTLHNDESFRVHAPSKDFGINDRLVAILIHHEKYQSAQWCLDVGPKLYAIHRIGVLIWFTGHITDGIFRGLTFLRPTALELTMAWKINKKAPDDFMHNLLESNNVSAAQYLLNMFPANFLFPKDMWFYNLKKVAPFADHFNPYHEHIKLGLLTPTEVVSAQIPFGSAPVSELEAFLDKYRVCGNRQWITSLEDFVSENDGMVCCAVHYDRRDKHTEEIKLLIAQKCFRKRPFSELAMKE